MAKEKSKKLGMLIPILVIVLILLLGLGLYLYKSDKIKKLGLDKKIDTVDENSETNKVKLSDYDLSDYAEIEKKEDDDGKYIYEYIVFTDKLNQELYSDFIEVQEEFMNLDDSGYSKKELKTIAETYKDLLVIYSVETHHIEDMPVFENINTLYINLKENKVLDSNDFIAYFDYNLEGLLNKMLEDLVENSQTNNYILPNGDHLSKDEFSENIQVYAQELSQLDFPSIYLYMDDGKLYMSYVESNILSYISIDHTTTLPLETVKTINLEII